MTHGDYRADIKNSTQLAAHRRKNGILILPVGCFEMHGPHACMSCDTFISEAASCVLAEAWDALVLPPIHYTFPGAPGPWPGTTDIAPEATLAYFKAVVEAVFKNGFQKLVVVNIHFPNIVNIEMMLRSVFQKTGHLPLFYNINYGALNQRMNAEWHEDYGEAMIMLGAMYLLGRHGDWVPENQPQERLKGPTWPTPNTWELKKRGTGFGYYFIQAQNHVGQYPGMKLEHAPRAAEIFREVLLSNTRDLPANYSAFIADMRKAMVEKPWDKL
jgi:creatinine amidohydrolase/Fe(II)-dependent formamide hydrolase-like protein